MPKPPPGGDGVPEEPKPRIPKSLRPRLRVPGGAAHAGKDGQMKRRGRRSSSGAWWRVSQAREGSNRPVRWDQQNVSGPRPKVVGVHEIDDVGAFELSVAAPPNAFGWAPWTGTTTSDRTRASPLVGTVRIPSMDDIPTRIEVKISLRARRRGSVSTSASDG